MKKKTHILCNAVIFFPLLLSNSILDIFIYINIILFSVFPDLDYTQKRSVFQIIPKLVSMLFLRKLKHRDLFHTLLGSFLGVLLVTWPYFFFLNNKAFYAIGFIYLSVVVHIYLDSLTVSGVKPFEPFSSKIFRGNLTNKESAEIMIILILFQVIFLLLGLKKDVLFLSNLLVLLLLKFVF
ncbi:MAG: metal-dependent hydrolase [Candidatus Woesearchaeota archaeon]